MPSAAVSASSDGSETRTCIDGKQRLTSLSRFMDGMIYYKDPDTKEKYWYKDAPGKPRQVLPESYQRLFANKQIVCVEYTDLKDDDERDIFQVSTPRRPIYHPNQLLQRVQMGMALTPAGGFLHPHSARGLIFPRETPGHQHPARLFHPRPRGYAPARRQSQRREHRMGPQPRRRLPLRRPGRVQPG